MLESLPGVGKVQARRIMEELDISESRRLRGLGRNQREGLLCAPQDRPQRLSRRPSRTATRAVLLVLAGPSGVGKGTIVEAAASATRASGCRSRARPARPAPGEVDGRRLPLRGPRRVRGPPRRRRLPRVVRGLRRPQGHAPGPGRRSTSPPATTCCSRSTCRARWRSGSVFPDGGAGVRAGRRRPRSCAGACVVPGAPSHPTTSSGAWPPPRPRRPRRDRVRRGGGQRRRGYSGGPGGWYPCAALPRTRS